MRNRTKVLVLTGLTRDALPLDPNTQKAQGTLFIRTKLNMQIFRVSKLETTLVKQQLNGEIKW